MDLKSWSGFKKLRLIIFWHFFQLWSWLLHIPTVADLKGWRSSTLATPWNTLLYFAFAIYSSKMCSTVIPLFSAPWTHSNAHKRVVSELMFGNDFFFFEKKGNVVPVLSLRRRKEMGDQDLTLFIMKLFIALLGDQYYCLETSIIMKLSTALLLTSSCLWADWDGGGNSNVMY